MNTEHFDIVIAGGGLAGATLAACLARYPDWRIAVLEKMPLPPSESTNQAATLHPSYDARNTALTNGTCDLFDQLGLWAELKPQAEPITHIHVSQQGGPGRAHIDASSEQVQALGYVIENRCIGQSLLQHIQQSPQVSYLAPAELTAIRYRAGGVTLTVRTAEQQRQLRTPLLVIADGAASAGRALLGIDAQARDYQQTAIVTTVTPADYPRGLALERFTQSGPLAILPQTEGRLGVTWCLAPEAAESLMAAADAEFCAALSAAAGSDLGALLRCGRRDAYPLKLTLTQEQIRPHAVVLGNAAHGLHPVAGQGFNLAVRDIVELVRVLLEARAQTVASGSDGAQGWGDFPTLQRYARARAGDQMRTIYFSDGITRLFGLAPTWASLGRGTGLFIFNRLPGLKRLLARQAMGRAMSMRLPARDPVAVDRLGRSAHG